MDTNNKALLFWCQSNWFNLGCIPVPVMVALHQFCRKNNSQYLCLSELDIRQVSTVLTSTYPVIILCFVLVT